jgi:hypothetical protein
MDTEQQYQRDIARIEAHRLALKEDEFHRLAQQIQEEVREHQRFLREERGAPIKLHDRDPERVTVENGDGVRVTTFTFNYLRHEADVRGQGVHYLFAIAIEKEKPVVTGRKSGQLLGSVSDHTVITAVRNAIESITDLPRPIVK